MMRVGFEPTRVAPPGAFEQLKSRCSLTYNGRLVFGVFFSGSKMRTWRHNQLGHLTIELTDLKYKDIYII